MCALLHAVVVARLVLFQVWNTPMIVLLGCMQCVSPVSARFIVNGVGGSTSAISGVMVVAVTHQYQCSCVDLGRVVRAP